MIAVVRRCHRIGRGLPAVINGLCRECYCGERYIVERRMKIQEPKEPGRAARKKKREDKDKTVKIRGTRDIAAKSDIGFHGSMFNSGEW